MENIGALCILLAFCFAVYAVVASVTGRLKKNSFLTVSGQRAVYSVWLLLTVAAGLLIYSLLTGDFRLAYVAAPTDWTMVIHPPMLYLGYVGFTVPFAFAMGSLITRQPGDAWIHTTRRWTIVTWVFQSAGILLGQGWASAVLGWG